MTRPYDPARDTDPVAGPVPDHHPLPPAPLVVLSVLDLASCLPVLVLPLRTVADAPIVGDALTSGDLVGMIKHRMVDYQESESGQTTITVTVSLQRP